LPQKDRFTKVITHDRMLWRHHNVITFYDKNAVSTPRCFVAFLHHKRD